MAVSITSKQETLTVLTQTPKAWVDVVLSDFNAFLLNHALCERKASALAMSMVAHYPDRSSIVTAMIDLALEEMAHFKQVMRYVMAKGLVLPPDKKDPYVVKMRQLARHGKDDYLMDQLLLCGIIEARGYERFALIAEHLEGKIQQLYATIARSEAKHAQLFVDLACEYFEEEAVQLRLAYLLEEEAKIIHDLPYSAALH